MTLRPAADFKRVALAAALPALLTLAIAGCSSEAAAPADAQGLAEALVAAWTARPSREAVRKHFDAHLSFPAVGRLWADAYAQARELHAGSPR